MPTRLVLLCSLAVVGAVAVAAAFRGREGEPAAYQVAGLETLTAREVVFESYWVAPAILSVVYDAFSRTEEAAIYDRLAEVAAGDALEGLYLERMGAMADAGLEPDQVLHEMEMIGLDARSDGDRVEMDAEWRVLGTVGHAEHLHVRGNAYAARLRVEPVDGSWRLTAFDLTDVDRTDAGTLQPRADNVGLRLGAQAD